MKRRKGKIHLNTKSKNSEAILEKKKEKQRNEEKQDKDDCGMKSRGRSCVKLSDPGPLAEALLSQLQAACAGQSAGQHSLEQTQSLAPLGLSSEGNPAWLLPVSLVVQLSLWRGGINTSAQREEANRKTTTALLSRHSHWPLCLCPCRQAEAGVCVRYLCV